MSKKKAEPTADAGQPEKTVGLVFELEKTGFNGTQLLYDVSSAALNEKTIDLTPALFSRYCLDRSLPQGLTGLLTALNKKKLSADKLAAEIREQFIAALSGRQIASSPALPALLEEARQKNMTAGVFSALPTENARDVMDKLKLTDLATLQISDDPAQPSPSSDGWLKLSKALRLTPRSCIALVTDALACRSALTAGMHCIALPNEFTVFQDFTGADLLLDDLKEIKFADLMAILHSCAFR